MDTKEFLVTLFRILAFIFCFLAFLWKTEEGFLSYLAEEVGTKIELWQNYDTELPAFAICRHPQQLFDIQTLNEEYNLNGTDMNKMKAYELAEERNETLLDIFRETLINDYGFIEKLEVFKKGHYSTISKPVLDTNPAKDAKLSKRGKHVYSTIIH